ncbi:YpiF family protein [Paenibacillus radicis (ex Xue et al. 2023)]|uniref:YpiF family protein n=1 Tax=Paenibacillus radicis (ex Xue et al. 2023) TaxID=2972489 RepID=A0ABT1YMT9_9BACL|nr:YpiF family protein [Paenibacillus radicis (ex Xue et al. 2023)]MCR8634487.1 YpiF family protein [Paenibacillus radicis (ex Xue et al. 2023)]
MKFSDVSQNSWEELRPYVDTCLLPVTGLTGAEQPWEAVQALEELRDALDCFEIPYKGRVLTYPAYHFVLGEEMGSMLRLVCKNLKENGFKYIVIVSAKSEFEPLFMNAQADLFFTLPKEKLNDSQHSVKEQISNKLQQLWSNKIDS